MNEKRRPLDSVTNHAVLKKILTTIGDPPPSVYAPSDDSLLMIDAIANHPLTGKKILDMGTGSGVLSLYCAMHGAEVTASDVDRPAVEEVGRRADELGVQVKLCTSDLFSNISDRFDLILFNPPYLPSVEVVDSTVDGGPGGTMLADRFLDELPPHLSTAAEAFLLLSSINYPIAIQLRHTDLEFVTVAKKSLFFEELQVLRVRLRDDLTV